MTDISKDLAALRIPHTAMVVTTDLVGNLGDIHPSNKWDVGHRLALVALAKDYGHNDLACSGPVYKSMRIDGNKAVLSFDNAAGGLTNKASGRPAKAKRSAVSRNGGASSTPYLMAMNVSHYYKGSGQTRLALRSEADDLSFPLSSSL